MSAGAGPKLVKFWKDNNLLITMGAIIVGGHMGWRWLQEQEEFVPKGTQKEYPWIEAARHYKEHQKNQQNMSTSTSKE